MQQSVTSFKQLRDPRVILLSCSSDSFAKTKIWILICLVLLIGLGAIWKTHGDMWRIHTDRYDSMVHIRPRFSEWTSSDIKWLILGETPLELSEWLIDQSISRQNPKTNPVQNAVLLLQSDEAHSPTVAEQKMRTMGRGHMVWVQRMHHGGWMKQNVVVKVVQIR